MNDCLVQKIRSTELSKYVVTSKNTYNSGGLFVLQPQIGSVVFDFNVDNATSCIVKFKRHSGNGILMLASGESSKGFQINSKSGQNILYNLADDKKLQVHRTGRSRGEISISEVLLYSNLKTDWNEELEKCEEHACLSLKDNKLFASNGGFIKGPDIHVETNPSGVFKVNGDRITFFKSCQIVELKVGSGIATKNKLEGPAPIERADQNSAEESENVIYDTKYEGFSQDFCNRDATVNSVGVFLNHKGSYNIPLTSLVKDKKYLISAEVLRVNGNGKFLFGILPDDNASLVRIAPTKPKKFSFEVIPKNDNYTLSIWRHQSAKGKIYVTRIFVKSDSELSENRKIEMQHIDVRQPESNMRHASPAAPVQSIPSIQPVFTTPSTQNDENIKNAFRHFSVFPVDDSVVEKKINLSGVLEPVDVKSRLWYNMVRNCFIDLKYVFNDGVAYHNDKGSKARQTVSLSSITNLKPFNRVFLHEIPDNHVISKNAEAILKQCVEIITPSLTDLFRLKKITGKDNVKLSNLPLPYVIGEYKTKNYYIYFEDDSIFTTKLVSAWNKDKGILYIVGSNASQLPDWVKHISPTCKYQELFRYIIEARGLIYFSRNTHHNSGLTDLARVCHIPILTNNHQFLMKETVVRNDVNNGVDVKDLTAIIPSFYKREGTKVQIDYGNYTNSIVVKKMNDILGK